MTVPGPLDLTASTGPGLVAEMFERLTETMADFTRRALANDRRIEAVLAVAERAGIIADLAMEQMGRVTPALRPIACAPGCDHCCRLPEPVTDVLTVIGLSYTMMVNLDLDLYRRLHARIALDARGCPLLEAGRCSVYGVRPLVCRGFNAYDIGNCARGLFIDGAQETGSALGDLWPLTICAALQDGIIEGLRHLGLDGRQVRLAPALRRILAERNAVSRWLAGEEVFADLLSSRAATP